MSGTDAGAETSTTPNDAAACSGGDGASVAADVDFDKSICEPAARRYGIIKLMELREAMMPIERAAEVKGLKFLHFPGYGVEDDEPEEKERRTKEDRGGDDRRSNDRKKGKGKGNKQREGGRYVPEMGKTELQTGYVKGQWWRNTAQNDLDVIVRDGFSLMSHEIWKVPNGHYVQQSGPAEVFVSGQAQGLTRMPVYPRGWVTSDASTVGGPKYLESVKVPRWQVSFKSDAPKGDILVREAVSLESEEVGCIPHGTFVEQTGPQETVEDGIIRMPISWPSSEPSSASGSRPKLKAGWVTCDATSQGGPKFFTAAPEEESSQTIAPEVERDRDDRGPAAGDRRAGNDGSTSWDKNRLWKIQTLEQSNNRSLPLVSRSEPYAPGGRHNPPEDIVVRWMSNGEVVEQIGHSKKTRGYMVMPVRLVSLSDGEQVKENITGWVTRRLVDKQRDNSEEAWITEIRDDDNDRDRRRNSRRDQR